MIKTLLALLTAFVVMFSGCASKNVNPDITTGLEGKKINTYFIGEYVDVKNATSRLESVGFEVIASYPSVKKGTTLVFTNNELKTEAAKPGRAYAAVLRLFIDEKEQKVSFSNPVYFGKAFMQNEYKHKVFNGALEKINKVFPDLKKSADELEYDLLAEYHFMVGMPYYNEPDLLGKVNKTTDDTVSKIKKYKKGKSLIFELKLSDASTLLGYDLGKRTKKFVKKIGRANAAILPWCISIEDGQAKALNAKYYIAISYPLLDMSGFMGIATVPGAIIKDLEKALK